MHRKAGRGGLVVGGVKLTRGPFVVHGLAIKVGVEQSK